MNINATLLGQMITFALFVWFTMRYVWPPIEQAMQARQKQIAEGLAAAERGQKELLLVQQEGAKRLHNAKQARQSLMDGAKVEADKLIAQARDKAEEEATRILAKTEQSIALMVNDAKASLREDVATLAVRGAERIVRKTIDSNAHDALLADLIKEI